MTGVEVPLQRSCGWTPAACPGRVDQDRREQGYYGNSPGFGSTRLPGESRFSLQHPVRKKGRGSGGERRHKEMR